MCDIFFLGGGKIPIDWALLPYGILSGVEVNPWGGGVPCDTGFNSPTEKVAENIVIILYGKY